MQFDWCAVVLPVPVKKNLIALHQAQLPAVLIPRVQAGTERPRGNFFVWQMSALVALIFDHHNYSVVHTPSSISSLMSRSNPPINQLLR